MTPDELRALLAAATPGEWKTRGSASVVTTLPGGNTFTLARMVDAPDKPQGLAVEGRRTNAALIVAAVNALPGLLDALAAAERERDAALAALEESGRKRGETLALLDKAVVALRGRMHCHDCTCGECDHIRATLAENIILMISVYVTLAAIIALGVVYNFSRIALSEQGRELASLRVLGFTRAEVAAVILLELAIVVLLAQPLGWLIGHGIGLAMVAAFSSDLYRVPFVMGREVYATASLIVLAAAILSAIAIRGRINRLDLIAVLKTRE